MRFLQKEMLLTFRTGEFEITHGAVLVRVYEGLYQLGIPPDPPPASARFWLARRFVPSIGW